MDDPQNPMAPSPMTPVPEAQTMELPAKPPQPTPPVQQPTLAEYSTGLNQVNRELQRQTDAYGHFRSIIAALNAIAQNPDAARPRLPFVKVAFPSDGEAVDVSIDLNSMAPADLAHFRPMFSMLAERAGNELLDAWAKIHKVADETRQIVDATRAAQGR